MSGTMLKLKTTSIGLWLGWAFPVLLEACPRCVDATPYKTGMQLAVVFLLPIPITLATLLFLWIRRESKSEGSDTETP